MPCLWPALTTAILRGTRRRWQFRVATLLALPGVVALGLAWAGVGRPPRDSYWTGLDGEIEWTQESRDYFCKSPDRRPCLLKVADLYGKAHLGDFYLSERWSMSIEFEAKWTLSTDLSVRGGSYQLPPTGVAAVIPAAIATMPRSDRGIAPGKVIAVGFRGPRGWETRVYDKAKLPPQVAKLFTAAGIAPR